MIAPFAELVRLSQTSIAEQNARGAQAGASWGRELMSAFGGKGDIRAAFANVR
jgi:hypothetical protein